MNRRILLSIVMIIAVSAASLTGVWIVERVFMNKSVAQPEKGFLEGKVSIGPICPVEHEDVPCPTPPEAYEARKIIIYDKDRRIVSTVDLDKDGNYRIALTPGIYVININYIGVDSSSDVPRQIEIEAGKTIRFDISIDTGVR